MNFYQVIVSYNYYFIFFPSQLSVIISVIVDVINKSCKPKECSLWIIRNQT